MTANDAYKKLLADEVWGPECRVLSELPESESAKPAVVGGAVRDLMLGRAISDLDIATSHPDTAGVLAEAYANATHRKLVEYSHEQTIYRVVGRGTPQVDFTDPVGGTRDADLERRDFTINALALGLVGDEKRAVLDPTGGLKDIESKTVRMTSFHVFIDDPLRLLRAFRFSAQLGFAIDEGTIEAIKTHAIKLRDVAVERIQLELLAMMEPDGLADQVLLMETVGLTRVLFPELIMQKGVEQNDYHHLDVWEHTVDSLRQIEKVLGFDEEVLVPYKEKIVEYIEHRFPSGHSRKSLIKLAMLLHDIAKPHCRAVREDGRVTFIGHERRGADIVGDHLTHLRFPIHERDLVCRYIAGHLRPAILGRDEPDRPRVAYRFFRDYEDASLGIIMIALADRLAAQGKLVTPKILDRHRQAVSFLLDCLYNQTEIVVRPPQLIGGGTLIHELGLEPGPMIGHLLKRVQEAQVMGEVKTREDALNFCREITGE